MPRIRGTIKLHVRGGCRQLIYIYVNMMLYKVQAVERVINRVSHFYSVVGIVQINNLWLLSGVRRNRGKHGY